VDAAEIQHFIDLELFLLSPGARLSPARLEELLDPDFREIGTSGRRWTRAETISALSKESAETSDDGPIRASDFEVTAVASDVVLVTFLTVGRGRRSLRSSIWRRSEGSWRVLHHQGTPLAP
jgi:hypothetical protein